MKKNILIVVTLLILEGTVTGASRCWARREVLEELYQATAVFSGEAINQEYMPIAAREGLWPQGSEVLVIKFSVERWWKGSFDPEVVLQTGVVRLPNGYVRMFGEDFTFSVGEKYLVYAFGIDRLSTDSCTRTDKLEKAIEDLSVLGEGGLPNPKKVAGFRSAAQQALAADGAAPFLSSSLLLLGLNSFARRS